MNALKTALLLCSVLLVSCTGDTDAPQNQDEYSLGGTVSGLDGDALILQNNAADDTTITRNGQYTLLGTYSDQSTYHLTIIKQPENPNQICRLTETNGTITGADVSTIDIVCTTTYTIGGHLYDLYGRGPIVVSNDDQNTKTLATDGPFEFDSEIEDGRQYAVTLTDAPQSLQCAIVNASGTVTGAPVTNINIYCNGVPVAADPTDRIDSFISLIYEPILRPNCRGCHEQGGPGYGVFADPDIYTAYYDTIRRIDIPNAQSLLVTRVQNGHMCWPTSGQIRCAENADTINTAIATWISQNYQ